MLLVILLLVILLHYVNAPVFAVEEYKHTSAVLSGEIHIADHALNIVVGKFKHRRIVAAVADNEGFIFVNDLAFFINSVGEKGLFEGFFAVIGTCIKAKALLQLRARSAALYAHTAILRDCYAAVRFYKVDVALSFPLSAALG